MKYYVATSQNPPFGRPGNRSWSFKPTQKTQVYDAIIGSGKDGATRKQIADKVGLAPDRISFYLSELCRGGSVAVKADPTVVSGNMSAEDAAMAALLGLETALVAKVKELGATAEMERGYVKYSKIKELALHPGTGAEGKVALRMALLELVKLVY